MEKYPIPYLQPYVYKVALSRQYVEWVIDYRKKKERLGAGESFDEVYGPQMDMNEFWEKHFPGDVREQNPKFYSEYRLWTERSIIRKFERFRP